MRFDEFKVNERQKLKEMYPHLTEEQLDEILPALGAAAGVAGKALATGAMTAGRVGAKMGTAAAKGAGKLAVKGAKAGAKLAGQAAKGVGKEIAKTAADVGAKVGDMAAQKLLKVGNKLSIGGQEVAVDSVTGDEVTFADPKKRDAPKTVIKKKNPIVQNALKSLVS